MFHRIFSDTHKLTVSMTHRSSGADPLIHYGRHFGRTVHSLCTITAILSNGLLRLADDSDKADEEYPPE